MNRFNKCLVNRLGLLTIAVAPVLLVSVSSAQIVTLTDNGSQAMVNLGSSAGMYEWTVTGLPTGMQNQLNQQWFWYSIGNGVAQPINTLSAANYSWNPSQPGLLNATYASSQLSITVTYTLTGGGIGQADMSEGITLQNMAPSTPINVNFFEYSDFNLLNDPNGDSVAIDNNYVVQWKGGTQIAEAIVAPDADYFEANTTGGTSSTLYKLNNTPNLTLDGNTSAGPGDVTWAYQWDFDNLTSEAIQKDKLLDVEFVPEPTTLALGLLGLGAVLLRRRVRA
jgi:hypothetical protein